VPISQVYTVTFLAEKGLTGSASYTTPPGFVAVVRDIQAYGSVTAAGSITVEGPVGEAIYFYDWPINGQAVDYRTVRVAYTAGQTITAVARVGPVDAVDVTVTGYLLTAS
jgi:hypothetical protein